MAEFPALPLWTDAFLADTTHLTRDEIGAYMLLLMAAWRRQDCALPDDDRALMSIARCSVNGWPRLRKNVVGAFFVKGEDGLLRQKRLSKERAYVEESLQRRRETSSRGGKARWLKYKEEIVPVEPSRLATHTHTHTHTYQEEVPTPSSNIPLPSPHTPHLPPTAGEDARPMPAAPGVAPADAGGGGEGDVDLWQEGEPPKRDLAKQDLGPAIDAAREYLAPQGIDYHRAKAVIGKLGRQLPVDVIVDAILFSHPIQPRDPIAFVVAKARWLANRRAIIDAGGVPPGVGDPDPTATLH